MAEDHICAHASVGKRATKKLVPTIKLALQYLAGLEQLPYGRGDFTNQLIDQAIHKIAAGKAFPTAHMWDLVVAQQIQLVKFLKQHPYPKGGIQNRKEWVMTHKDKFTKEIVFIPCVCGYSSENWECDYAGRLEGFWEEKPWIECVTPEELTVAVLAALHTVGIHRMRKALKDKAKDSKCETTYEMQSEDLGNGKVRITSIPRRVPLKS